MSTVISVENLGKKYTLHHQQREQYTALRDVIANGVKCLCKKIISPFTLHPSPLHDSQEDFWALRDVSFEVKQGDRIGIIGRNGAGKSTLLKILSRITEPTTGSVRIKGRVASLLEVGTGFHPELTGRENIFLNGAILGMGRAEIRKKFDEIVDFAEIEKFLDTPVKRYSSGMYVRLAFAVAAHLEPDILIVDEVLAVGDAQFQKKCLGKMEDVSAREGRTVLFVSHNMSAVTRLCSTCLLLVDGRIGYNGNIAESIEQYLYHNGKDSDDVLKAYASHSGEKKFARFTGAQLFNKSDEPCTEFRIGDSLKMRFTFELQEDVNLEIGFAVLDHFGVQYGRFIGEWEGVSPNYKKGTHMVLCEISSLPYLPGTYHITPWLKKKGWYVDHQIDSLFTITIISSDINGHNPDFERYQTPSVYTASRWVCEC